MYSCFASSRKLCTIREEYVINLNHCFRWCSNKQSLTLIFVKTEKMPESNETNESPLVEEKVKPEEEKKKNDEVNIRQFEWLVRPCEIYKEEYSDCKSIKARLHQYYVFGETIDCSQWKTDYNNCYLWEKHKSEKAFASLVDSEKKRRLERLRNHYANNIWEKRENPPENWNAPLPEWLQNKNEHSYLQTLIKEGGEGNNKSSSCSIS